MLEAIVHPFPEIHVTIHDVPIPVPGPDQVLIKVSVAGSNVKDWGHLTSRNLSLNSGDDMAGTVHEIGANVKAAGHFKLGDRVAGFHQMFEPAGAYAEYAVAPARTTFKIPATTSFEEAATMPLIMLTAALTLFRRLVYPAPWKTATNSTPLIVYGASSALGSFTIKLARLANIHPIIAIGGGSSEGVRALLEAELGDAFVDYRSGTDTMLRDVAAALKGRKTKHGIDSISSNKTWIPLSTMLDPEGQSLLSVVSGAHAYEDEEIPTGVKILYTYVGSGHTGAYLPAMPKQPDAEEVKGDVVFAGMFFRWLEGALAKDEIVGHPFVVTPGGLEGVGLSLRSLQEGKAKGRKFVCRVAETPGLQESNY